MTRLKHALAGLLGVGVLAMPLMAHAGVINACMKKNNGQLRVVSDPASCHPSEVPIAFAGPTEVVTVWQNVHLGIPPDSPVPAGQAVQVTATCPDGMVVLGGGGQANDPSVVQPNMALLATSRPDPYFSDNPTGWFVSGARTEAAGPGELQVVASVICGG